MHSQTFRDVFVYIFPLFILEIRNISIKLAVLIFSKYRQSAFIFFLYVLPSDYKSEQNNFQNIVEHSMLSQITFLMPAHHFLYTVLSIEYSMFPY